VGAGGRCCGGRGVVGWMTSPTQLFSPPHPLLGLLLCMVLLVFVTGRHSLLLRVRQIGSSERTSRPFTSSPTLPFSQSSSGPSRQGPLQRNSCDGLQASLPLAAARVCILPLFSPQGSFQAALLFFLVTSARTFWALICVQRRRCSSCFFPPPSLFRYPLPTSS